MKKIACLFSFVLISLFLVVSCKKPSCSNKIKDGNETNIDCGGKCPACVEKTNTNPTASQSPSSPLIGTWYLIRRTRIDKPYYGNAASIELGINVSPDLCKIELTDILNPDSTKKCFGSFTGCNYPAEDYWTYDSLAYIQIETGNNSIGFKILSQTLSSLFLTMGYYDFYYSKLANPYVGTVPQVQVELKIFSNLPANALVADGDTLSAGQTLWTKTYTGSGNQAQFIVDVVRPSNSTATGNIVFEMIIKDSNGNVLVSSGGISTLLEGYPPPPPGQTDGPPQGDLNIKYTIKWG